MFKYMLRIAGQTAGPIGLKFFVDTIMVGLVKGNFLFFYLFFHGQRLALQLVYYKLGCSDCSEFDELLVGNFSNSSSVQCSVSI